MKVLFICSGKAGDVGHVVKNQGESLKRAGIEIEYLTIKPGLTGYLGGVQAIRKRFREGRFDLAHAHYGLSAFSATMAHVRPLVVSLMGSEAFAPWLMRRAIKLFAARRWEEVIVKTDEMKSRLGLEHAQVIPNGVDAERFAPMDMAVARRMLNLDPDHKLVLFISVNDRPEKRLSLATESVKSLDSENIRLIHLRDTPNEQIPLYMNAADLLLLTSEREGSVNVIKEAMACNCPVVSTDVGDVRWVTEETDGCYLALPEPSEIADKIRKVLDSGRRTCGRDRIFLLGLDAGTVTGRIADIYRKALTKG